MTAYFKKVDKFLESSEMPEEYKGNNFIFIKYINKVYLYADTKALVFCNDCEKKTYAPYHFQYHKCQHCFSYNTAVIKIVRGP
jgi:RING finger/CHY zinc finger protein 1